MLPSPYIVQEKCGNATNTTTTNSNNSGTGHNTRTNGDFDNNTFQNHIPIDNSWQYETGAKQPDDPNTTLRQAPVNGMPVEVKVISPVVWTVADRSRGGSEALLAISRSLYGIDILRYNALEQTLEVLTSVHVPNTVLTSLTCSYDPSKSNASIGLGLYGRPLSIPVSIVCIDRLYPVEAIAISLELHPSSSKPIPVAIPPVVPVVEPTIRILQVQSLSPITSTISNNISSSEPSSEQRIAIVASTFSSVPYLGTYSPFYSSSSTDTSTRLGMFEHVFAISSSGVPCLLIPSSSEPSLEHHKK